MDEFVGGYAHHRLEEGQGIAGKALQSNIHIQHDIYVLDLADFPNCDNQRVWQNRTFHASFAIRLTSTHSCKDDYVLEFFLPNGMKDTSERELLISKVLRTLQKNCLESWKVWVRELNEASGNGVGLDDERMPNIPHEALLGVNEFMTFNPTSNQAGETHEPLEQVIFLSNS
ncbi:PROTEIN NLP8 [Salix koriyanagi]|uniref:PROTEIN NLP8 n=1 Tax=Salix koriyanagi TaxID=2511006 RepID=A0A9Q1APX4_9ROSI|nr:PROTEIN NLP8 [Salix koriyanagi]